MLVEFSRLDQRKPHSISHLVQMGRFCASCVQSAFDYNGTIRPMLPNLPTPKSEGVGNDEYAE